MRSYVAVAALALTVGGCGTITRGTTEKVTVDSVPPGARVESNVGFTCPATPCIWDVPRKTDFVASFSLPGYAPMQIPVITKFGSGGVGAAAGNILLIGGVAGLVIDASTGAGYDHDPNPVVAQLTPLPQPAISSRRPGPRKIRRAPRPDAES